MDKNELMELFEENSNYLRAVTYTLTGGDQFRAEDLYQDVAARLWTTNATLRNARSYKGWVKTIARNIYYKQCTKKSEFYPEETPRPDRESLDYGLIESALGEDDIIDAINDLPHQMQTIFELNYLGYSHKEIGNMLDIKEASSRSTLARAKAKLQQHIISLDC